MLAGRALQARVGRRGALGGGALLACPGAASGAGPPARGGAGTLQENTLDTCAEGAASCVSSFADDETHFLNPWSYGGSRDDELRRFRRAAESSRFGGRVVEVDEAAGYARAEFPRGARPGGRCTLVAEVLYAADDEVVNVRVEGDGEFPRLALSLVDGVRASRDCGARELGEDLRIALGYAPLPVISAWDPRFNDERKLIFERAFEAVGTPSALDAADAGRARRARARARP